MSKTLSFANSKKFNLNFASGEEAFKYTNKKWSFSNVYHFEEIRDIYLIIALYNLKTPKAIYNQCQKLSIGAIQKQWTERRILEYLNALKNFGVLEISSSDIKLHFEFKSTFNEQLHEADMAFFKNIYFSYFRFKELMSWFILDVKGLNPDIKFINEQYIRTESKPLFSYIRENKFHDSFFFNLKNNSDLFIISSSKEDKISESLKRFWDVFIKWGKRLNLIQRFNLDVLGYKVDHRSISCTYFLNNDTPDFDLRSYIIEHFPNKYIYLPDLVFHIATNKRLSLEFVKRYIINEYERNKFSFNLERTSEIFIKKGKIYEDDVIFHPFYKNSYVSNIILL